MNYKTFTNIFSSNNRKMEYISNFINFIKNKGEVSIFGKIIGEYLIYIFKITMLTFKI